jgi:SET domain-containing protein
VDVCLSPEEYKKLEPSFKDSFDKYGRKDKISGKYMINTDDTRFMNHSKTPNIEHRDYELLAARDIVKGEELCDNYYDFD